MLALSSLRRWCGIVPSVRAALLARRALHGDQLVGDLQHVLVAGALDQVLAVDHQRRRAGDLAAHRELLGAGGLGVDREAGPGAGEMLDRKSTRLNSSHYWRTSYAVFCLRKQNRTPTPNAHFVRRHLLYT